MHLARFRSFVEPRSGAARCMSAAIPIVAALASIVAVVTQAGAAPANPSGLWSTKDDESIIEIAPCGTLFCGTLIWMKEPNESDGTAKLDTKNEDSTKRGRPWIGIVLLIDLAPEKTYWRGKAYNPDDGKTYDITFKFVPGKIPAEKAEVEGCVLRFLCQSETFTRAQAIPGQPVPTTHAPAKPPTTPKATAPRP